MCVRINSVYIIFTELGEARSELAPIEDKVEKAKTEKNSMASVNSKEMKKLEADIRSIRDQQKDFEQIYNQVKEYKMSRNEEKLTEFSRKSSEIRENVQDEQKKEQETNDQLIKVCCFQ